MTQVTIALASSDDAELIAHALRAQAEELRLHAENGQAWINPSIVHKPRALRLLTEAGVTAMTTEADDLDDLAALIDSQLPGAPSAPTGS